jgi:O-methyltransferase involved in polyketide biosynthesis
MARTEGDTWDLASSVGATATMVAAQRALGHREKLIDDPFAEPLVRAVGVELFTKMLDGGLDLTAIDPAFTVRRAAEGMAIRTRFFDGMFLDGAAAGVRQAVILAAGLDARSYRLPFLVGRHGRLRGRPARGHPVQDEDTGRDRRDTDGHAPHRVD